MGYRTENGPEVFAAALWAVFSSCLHHEKAKIKTQQPTRNLHESVHRLHNLLLSAAHPYRCGTPHRGDLSHPTEKPAILSRFAEPPTVSIACLIKIFDPANFITHSRSSLLLPIVCSAKLVLLLFVLLNFPWNTLLSLF